MIYQNILQTGGRLWSHYLWIIVMRIWNAGLSEGFVERKSSIFLHSVQILLSLLPKYSLLYPWNNTTNTHFHIYFYNFNSVIGWGKGFLKGSYTQMLVSVAFQKDIFTTNANNLQELFLFYYQVCWILSTV